MKDSLVGQVDMVVHHHTAHIKIFQARFHLEKNIISQHFLVVCYCVFLGLLVKTRPYTCIAINVLTMLLWIFHKCNFIYRIRELNSFKTSDLTNSLQFAVPYTSDTLLYLLLQTNMAHSSEDIKCNSLFLRPLYYYSAL